MSEKKGWGSTVLGWFVVKGEDETTGAAREPSEAPVAAPPAEISFVKEPPAAPGGNVDFGAVFEAAGIDAEEHARVAKAAELLKTLPAGTDAAVKKQIVEAALKAFGVPIEKIIEAGVHEIQALEGYIRKGAADTRGVQEDGERKIAAYEAEIRQVKAVMDERVQEQQAVMKASNERKLEIQRVLEFFGQEAVARVVRESPRLIDPSAPGT